MRLRRQQHSVRHWRAVFIKKLSGAAEKINGAAAQPAAQFEHCMQCIKRRKKEMVQDNTSDLFAIYFLSDASRSLAYEHTLRCISS